MKCLLCNFESNGSDDVKKHYSDFHNVVWNNQFFIRLFKNQNNVFHGKRCLRCNEFLPSSRFRVNLDFLVQCDVGRKVFEGKPVNYTNFGVTWKYEITFTQHSHDYDFYNAKKSVDDFLLNVKNIIGRSSSNFFIKCGFSVENIQRLLLTNN